MTRRGAPKNLLSRPPRGAASKGARATNAKRSEKKAMREVFEAILDMPLDDGKLDNIKNLREVNGKNVTVSQAIALAMATKALKGDVQAAAFIRDTSGQKPKDELEVIHNDSQTIIEIDAYLRK